MMNISELPAVATMYGQDSSRGHTGFSLALHGVCNGRLAQADPGSGGPSRRASIGSVDSAYAYEEPTQASPRSSGSEASYRSFDEFGERHMLHLGASALRTDTGPTPTAVGTEALLAPIQRIQADLRQAMTGFNPGTRMCADYFFSDAQMAISSNARHAYARAVLETLGVGADTINGVLENENQRGGELIIDACRLLAMPSSMQHGDQTKALETALKAYVRAAAGKYDAGQRSWSKDSCAEFTSLERAARTLGMAMGPDTVRDELLVHLTPALLKVLAGKHPDTCASRLLERLPEHFNTQAFSSFSAQLRHHANDPLALLHLVEKLPHLLKGERGPGDGNAPSADAARPGASTPQAGAPRQFVFSPKIAPVFMPTSIANPVNEYRATAADHGATPVMPASQGSATPPADASKHPDMNALALAFQSRIDALDALRPREAVSSSSAFSFASGGEGTVVFSPEISPVFMPISVASPRNSLASSLVSGSSTPTSPGPEPSPGADDAHTEAPYDDDPFEVAKLIAQLDGLRNGGAAGPVEDDGAPPDPPPAQEGTPPPHGHGAHIPRHGGSDSLKEKYDQVITELSGKLNTGKNGGSPAVMKNGTATPFPPPGPAGAVPVRAAASMSSGAGDAVPRTSRYLDKKNPGLRKPIGPDRARYTLNHETERTNARNPAAPTPPSSERVKLPTDFSLELGQRLQQKEAERLVWKFPRPDVIPGVPTSHRGPGAFVETPSALQTPATVRAR